MEERRSPNGITDYDPAKLLTMAGLIFVLVLIVFVCFIIGIQIAQGKEPNTASWAALTGLIGWATSQVSIIFSNRYGTTQSSAMKDVTIAQQAKTAATVAAVVAPAAPVVAPAAPVVPLDSQPRI